MGFHYDPLGSRAVHLKAELWRTVDPGPEGKTMFRRMAALLIFALGAGLAQAQEATPWQSSVSGQIEAMQSGAAAKALEYAGSGFRDVYDDPEKFLSDVRRSGYGPIVDARSYSFGVFEETGNGTVLQVVTLVGADQRLYEAVYEMINEDGAGWRVRGVVLRNVPGIGI